MSKDIETIGGYTAPKYPRKLFSNDKRRKLTMEEISEMKMWREQGKSYSWIGSEFGVSGRTAHYHTDEEWAAQQNKKRYQLLARKYESEPRLLEEKRKKSSEYFKQRLSEPAIREFKAKHTYKWKKSKYHNDDDFREKTKGQARAAYHRKKALTNALYGKGE